MSERTSSGTRAPRRRSAAGFDFTRSMRTVCQDMVVRLPELRHIDFDRVALSFCQTRKRVSHGLQATLTPLRFAGGSRATVRRGRRYTIQQLLDAQGREMLYLLSFYLPRFLDTDFREKLVTILHELWHISPEFNGDLRRHPGRCYAHTRSQAEYDEEMGRLADWWLAHGPPETVYSFLRYSFNDLARVHGGVYGVRVRHPKPIPVADK